MKTIQERIRSVQLLKKKAYPVYTMVRPKMIKAIESELGYMRSKYKFVDDTTKTRFKNDAIGLKMLLQELEITP